MTTEQFSLEVGRIFQKEWQRARRKALALAFTAGMVAGLLLGSFHAELSHLWGGWGGMTDQSLINPSSEIEQN